MKPYIYFSGLCVNRMKCLWDLNTPRVEPMSKDFYSSSACNLNLTVRVKFGEVLQYWLLARDLTIWNENEIFIEICTEAVSARHQVFADHSSNITNTAAAFPIIHILSYLAYHYSSAP
jgi:hypothetical protein